MNIVNRSCVICIFLVCLTLLQSAFGQSPRVPYPPTATQPPARKAAQVKLIKSPALELFRNHEAIIRWTSSNPGGSDEHWGLIKYGTDPKHLNETAQSHIRLNRAHPDTIFRVRVEGLKLGTTYYYTIASMNADGSQDALKSEIYNFTAPDHDWAAPVPALREGTRTH